MDDLPDIFIDEALELLEEIERCTQAPKQTDSHLETILRNFHTIKGNAGMFDYGKVVSIVHAAESLVKELDSSNLSSGSTINDLLTQTVRALRRLLADIEQLGHEGYRNYEILEQTLSAAEAKISEDSDTGLSNFALPPAVMRFNEEPTGKASVTLNPSELVKAPTRRAA